jgi:hypothetical protein
MRMTVNSELGASSSVAPSGAACAASSSARLPFEPGRFSTTTGCPSRAVSGCAIRRAMKSDAPPGGNDSSSLSGRVG